MATKPPIPLPLPPSMAHLANKFRTTIFTIDLKSTLNSPTRYPDSTSITDTGSSTTYIEFLEQDYLERISNQRSIETVDYLREIAMKMNSAGYLEECIQIYTKERASVIAAIFHRLEVQKLRQLDPRVGWGSFGSFVSDWCRSANICVRFLFLHEKRLCHQIFQGLGNPNYDEEDACFVETIKEFPTQLFDSADSLCSVTSVRPSPDKIFKILDLYETLSSILPLINDLFSSELSKSIRVRPVQLLHKLAELIRCILSDLERDVLQGKSPIRPIPDIDPLSRYVMNYVRLICDYKQTLMASILPKPSTELVVELVEYEEQNRLSLYLISIVMRLLFNLEAKSKLYKEASLGNFFILKNVDYIVGNIEGSPELQDLIGDRYLKKLSSELCEAKVEYLRLTFDKMLYCLRVEGLNGCGIFSSKAKRMTKRLKSFNQAFGKAQRDLENLVVPADSQLVVDVQKSILEKLIPAYSSFLEQLRSKPSAEEEIKYSVGELKAAILIFFKCY